MGRGRYKERMLKGEYDENIMHSCMKMEKQDLYSKNGGIKENDGGMNSTMIYCKHFCKHHNVPLVQQ
jgi:hypothetical protein